MRFDHAALQVPDVAEAVRWYLATIPGSRVLYQDATWGLIEAGGARIAFVLPEQHPGHLAWRVGEDELLRLAAENGTAVMPHRDGTRSIYLDGPGGHAVEIITYPDDA